VQDEVLAELGTSGAVAVIVNFEDPAPDFLLGDLESHRAAIATAREALLAAGRGGLVPTRVFAHIPAIAGRLNRTALELLSRFPGVSFIQVDSAGHGSLAVSVPAIGADVAKRDNHVTGKGIRVAVLDTGINSTHPDLKSSVVPTQHCFTHADCAPGNLMEGASAEDDHGHGSHVSGIITSDGITAGAGFAPDAEIVAVKINDRANSGFASDWAAGLDWVFSNLSTLNVKLVNTSISTNKLYGSTSECDSAEPALAKAAKNLIDAGVTIFAAAGNQGSSSKLSAPACNTGVIAVGATYKSNQGRQPASNTYAGLWGSTFADCADQSTAFDQVTCFTNSGPRLDMVAPGALIISDVLGTKTEGYRGTSQASPTAAGVAALMLECNPKLTPADIRDILVRTGVPLTDPKNGGSYPSIRAAAAVKEACVGQQVVDAGNDASLRDSATVRDIPLSRDGTDDRNNRDIAAGIDGSLDLGTALGPSGTGGASGSGAATSGTAGKFGTGGGATGGNAGNGGAVSGIDGSGGSTRAGGGGAGSGGVKAAGGRIGIGGMWTEDAGAAPSGAGGHAGSGVAGSSTSRAPATGCSCRVGATPDAPAPTRLALAALLATLLRRHLRRRPESCLSYSV
jgi:MYXO-CTERM domain-containing protein